MSRVQIFEVGPRDGLQNEKGEISLATKKTFIQKLSQVGLKEIEAGLFVRPDRAPQMKDTDALFEAIRSRKLKLKNGTKAWALLANERGLERAIRSGVKQIAVFTGTTDSFVRRNIGMSVQESLSRFKTLVKEAKRNRIQVRGYVSMAFGCPIEGEVKPNRSRRVIESLVEMGCFQVSVGDTVGVATPGSVERLLKPLLREHAPRKLALHFHDTRGTALANALRSYDLGIRVFDSSAGGLGGCPFAPGATGNLATEDLVYMFHGMKVKTGVDLEGLAHVSEWLSKKMNRPFSSKYLQAYFANRKPNPKRKIRSYLKSS